MANNSIGQFIAALRKANGMTQQDVADRLNVSNKAVSRWERDECAPDISVIPALAEMFGVTCDELLRGERFSETVPTDKKNQKAEKQITSLITRTLSGFKTMIIISFTAAVIGLVCMFGISYGFFRPAVGFAVMLLFEACSFAFTALAVSRTKDVKSGNELFETADNDVVSKFDNTLGSLSFTAFFVIFAVVLLSFPLLITADDLNSVLTAQSYFTVFFDGILLILTLIYLKCKKPYMAWITDNQLPGKLNDPALKSVRTMSALQIGLIILAGVIFALAPYLQTSYDGFSLFEAVVIIGLGCIAASVICFIVYFIRKKEARGLLMLPGIRNIFLTFPALFVSEAHSVSWQGDIENEYNASLLERCDVWQTEYLWFALKSAVFIFIAFSLIEKLYSHYKRKKSDW